MKKWIILDKSKKRLPEDIVKILLKNRGIENKREIDEFLNPSLAQLNIKNAGLKKRELDKAVSRIKKAIRKDESIVVYTDYDVDGICAGAIVWETLYKLKAKVMPYIPHRFKEGYGLSKTGIDFVKKKHNSTLIIAVDHGASGGKEIDYAGKLGIDVIVLDHHILPKKIPLAEALIHTEKLAAGGIALLFADYLLSEFPSEKNENAKISNLELAAFSTIADLVPLKGLNRVIVKYGLDFLNKTKRLGFNVLIKESGLKKGEITARDVSFILAPRINASGRIDHAIEALRLICTKDRCRAEELSRKLTLINRTRQTLMTQSTLHAFETVKRDLIGYSHGSRKLSKLLFVKDISYNEGIIGLIAGKLVEEFYRPAIVVSVGEEYSKASARSIDGLNIVDIIRGQSHLLENFGGHRLAAGFSIATKNLDLIEEGLTKAVTEELHEDKPVQPLKIDLEISLNDVTNKLYTAVNRLSPFGMGNPRPTFVSRGVGILNASLVGKDKKHLKLHLRSISAIGFKMGNFYEKLSGDKPVDIVYTIDENKWNNKSQLQLKLKDIKSSEI